MSLEGKKGWPILEGDPQEHCQLSVDTENQCLILEFSQPIEVFGFDLETGQSFRDALDKGIKILRQLHS